MIPRAIESILPKYMGDPKALLIFGARQCGKTTMLEELLDIPGKKMLWWNGDDADVRLMLENPSSTKLKALIGNHDILVIDEAQRIENIGICIKIIVDRIKGVKVIATGSSAFELANKINEPITGRKWEFQMFPLSFSEMVAHHGLLEEKRWLGHRLVFGSYPEIVTNPGTEQERLKHLADSYLYKDILNWERIKKPEKLEKLVRALAFQVGSEVSYNELGQLTGLDNETVEKYIQLLEKGFVVFRLTSLSKNLRNELKKSRKIYFYDNGVRNAVINQFNPIEFRQDIGALWENYLISERMKKNHQEKAYLNTYFWRTHAQQEIDYVEEKNGFYKAFEFKWNPGKKALFSKSFTQAYPKHALQVISPHNVEEFLLPK